MRGGGGGGVQVDSLAGGLFVIASGVIGALCGCINYRPSFYVPQSANQCDQCSLPAPMYTQLILVNSDTTFLLYKPDHESSDVYVRNKNQRNFRHHGYNSSFFIK